MPDTREEFITAAAKAAKLGEAERRALAESLAADLETDPAHFDPKKLIALGRAGLEIFAATVTAQAAQIGASSQDGDDPPAPKGADVQGWGDLRKPERGFIARAVILGLSGSFFVIIIALLARFFSH
jgi:hypothetical protein